MELGIAVASTTESWRVVQRAEELGFAEAWFYDTQLLNPDVFVCMALAAERTTRIRLATGVLIPSNRIAPVAANCLATLNRLAPGRVKFGVGTGFTGRRTMGLPAIRLADMREYVRVVLGLLAGDTVEWETEGLRRKIRFLNPDYGHINTSDAIPLAISAFGPKARRLTAELGAEWLNFGGSVETAIAALRDMQAAWRDAGHAPEDLRAVEFTLGCVLEDGEPASSPRARAQAGTLVAATLHGLLETPELDAILGHLPAAMQQALASYRGVYQSYEPPDARYLTLHRGHLMRLRPEEEPLIGPDLLRALTWVGTEEGLRERAQALAAAGYTQVAIQVVDGHEDAVEDWARVFQLDRRGSV
jgi:5,10-methylenetetrahydromethanopterin reductase